MKKQLILAGGVIVFTAGVVIFFVYQSRRIEKEIMLTTPTVKPDGRAPKQRRLVPEDPREYGMVVFEENNQPRSQEDWDRVMAQKIREAKEQCPPEAWDKAWEKKKETPQKTAEKLQKIEAEMKKCREILTIEPANQEAEEKLERLIMLKAIAKELKP